MEDNLKDDIKVNTIDIGLLQINNKDVEYKYYVKMIRMVNLIIRN